PWSICDCSGRQRRSASSAGRPAGRTTRSVEDGIPTEDRGNETPRPLVEIRAASRFFRAAARSPGSNRLDSLSFTLSPIAGTYGWTGTGASPSLRTYPREGARGGSWCVRNSCEKPLKLLVVGLAPARCLPHSH